MQSLELFFRPVEINFKETEFLESGVKYEITCRVLFYADENMTNVLYEKQIVLTDVPFIPEWNGVLTDIYTRLENKIK